MTETNAILLLIAANFSLLLTFWLGYRKALERADHNFLALQASVLILAKGLDQLHTEDQ